MFWRKNYEIVCLTHFLHCVFVSNFGIVFWCQICRIAVCVKLWNTVFDILTAKSCFAFKRKDQLEDFWTDTTKTMKIHFGIKITKLRFGANIVNLCFGNCILAKI